MGKQLLFSTSVELVKVPADAVVYITAQGNYSLVKTAGGDEYLLTKKLGDVESRLSSMTDNNRCSFVRIGKSLIINCNFISYIHTAQKKLVMSDSRTFRHELSASREALRLLKEVLEEEGTII
ncbi:MAG TPA: hypothetical protein DC009_05445 [Porphyromonadaceae bacterium]|nr:hypothetical protein [Porphyromonadaceae bacterium]